VLFSLLLISFSCFGLSALVIALVHITLSLPCGAQKKDRIRRVKYWEIIADNLSKAGWTWGCVSAADCQGRTIWIVDAHHGDGKRLLCVLMKS
jgi:hypothetical protein